MILTPQMEGFEAAGELPMASTLCNACEAVCPVRIPIPAIIERLAAHEHDPGCESNGNRSHGSALWGACPHRSHDCLDPMPHGRVGTLLYGPDTELGGVIEAAKRENPVA